jgi:hypothetical protein
MTDQKTGANTHRRIEISAFRRRVTIVSGEWQRDIINAHPAQTEEDEVSLNDTDSCAPIAPDSPEGQLIIVEAVRSLEQRLAPEIRAARRAGQDVTTLTGSNRNAFYLRLQSFYQLICARPPRFFRKEK